jgi:hypothetical protein
LIQAGDLGLAVGDGVEGSLHMPETGRSCVFVAEAVWVESKDGVVGAKFLELAAAATELLDSYMAHWIKRSRR